MKKYLETIGNIINLEDVKKIGIFFATVADLNLTDRIWINNTSWGVVLIKPHEIVLKIDPEAYGETLNNPSFENIDKEKIIKELVLRPSRSFPRINLNKSTKSFNVFTGDANMTDVTDITNDFMINKNKGEKED